MIKVNELLYRKINKLRKRRRSKLQVPDCGCTSFGGDERDCQWALWLSRLLKLQLPFPKTRESWLVPRERELCSFFNFEIKLREQRLWLTPLKPTEPEPRRVCLLFRQWVRLYLAILPCKRFSLVVLVGIIMGQNCVTQPLNFHLFKWTLFIWVDLTIGVIMTQYHNYTVA